MIEHMVAIKGESCILDCFGAAEPNGLRSTAWIAKYAFFKDVISDLVHFI